MRDNTSYRLFCNSLILSISIMYYPFLTLSYYIFISYITLLYSNKHACHWRWRKLRSLRGWSNATHHLRSSFGVCPLVILQNQRWHHEESHHDKYSMRCQSHRTTFWGVTWVFCTVFFMSVFWIIERKKKQKVKSFLTRTPLCNVIRSMSKMLPTTDFEIKLRFGLVWHHVNWSMNKYSTNNIPNLLPEISLWVVRGSFWNPGFSTCTTKISIYHRVVENSQNCLHWSGDGQSLKKPPPHILLMLPLDSLCTMFFSSEVWYNQNGRHKIAIFFKWCHHFGGFYSNTVTICWTQSWLISITTFDTFDSEVELLALILVDLRRTIWWQATVVTSTVGRLQVGDDHAIRVIYSPACDTVTFIRGRIYNRITRVI